MGNFGSSVHYFARLCGTPRSPRLNQNAAQIVCNIVRKESVKYAKSAQFFDTQLLIINNNVRKNVFYGELGNFVFPAFRQSPKLQVVQREKRYRTSTHPSQWEILQRRPRRQLIINKSVGNFIFLCKWGILARQCTTLRVFAVLRDLRG